MALVEKSGHAQLEGLLWAAWSDHVRGLLNPSNDKLTDEMTQIVSSPQTLGWNVKPYGDYEFCRFADSLSANGPIYANSDQSVYRMYQAFIRSGMIQSSVNQPDVAKLVKEGQDPSQVHVLKGSDGTAYSCPRFTYSPTFDQLAGRSARNVWELGKDQYSNSRSKIWGKVRVGPFVNSFGVTSNSGIRLSDVVKINCQFNLCRIAIQPGSWYSATFVELFSQSSSVSGAVAVGPTASNADGPCRCSPKEAVVALHPKVVLTLSSDAYSSLKRSSLTGRIIDIGPFRFGEHQGRSTFSADDVGKTLTLEDGGLSPFLIAVLNSPLRYN